MKRIKLLLLMLLPFIGFSQVYVESIEGEQIVNHKAYTLSYNENCEQANWVYYVNTIDHIRNDSLERDGAFRMDKAITTKSASNRDYSKSGFDKGHMAPAADMLFDHDVVYEANFMSNVSPQYPGLNRGPWLQLESRVREFSWFQDSVHVLVGPILTGDMETIGGNEVCIM
jgi:endonuclease G